MKWCNDKIIIAGLFLVCLVVFPLSVSAQSNLYVATNGVDNTDAGRGQSWALPYRTISNGVAHANTQGDKVLVSNGVYTNLTQISISKSITLQSANGAAATIIDGNYPAITSRCVQFSSPGAVIDGFTIRNGYALAGIGGGVYFDNNGGTLRNCIVISNKCGNSSGYGGAGIFIYSTSLVENCVITRNSDIGGGGGGIYFRNTCNTNALVVNCTISENTSTGNGGGICILGGAGIMRSCLIVNNVASSSGGGIISFAIGGTGGGILQNCTVVSNRPNGMYIYSISSTGMVINTIVYSNYNSANYTFDGTSVAIFSNSCFYPALSGGSASISGNNKTNNPQFTDAPVGNYRPAVRSPAINAGVIQSWMSGVLDLDGHSRLDRFSGLVDMGCYEFVNSGSILTVRGR